MATAAQTTQELSNFINGESRPAADGASEPILNPATGEQIATAPLSGEADVDAAVQAAKGAFKEWSETPPGERALALLRARPNKELNMDELASQVGLSRSRFYDLFQLCTGFSPRAYLDMLCVETAISRLSSGQGKIAEVSAELGFSAQSNFTRFFLNQVGVPPSEYRRAATRDSADENPPSGG